VVLIGSQVEAELRYLLPQVEQLVQVEMAVAALVVSVVQELLELQTQVAVAVLQIAVTQAALVVQEL
jgi:hypothetical protein